ncbi:SCO2400 family protein [Streptomyces sp. NPDC000880]
MDYCSSCRRTLNGALVCPGCGAYAPDIAPPAPYLDDAAAKIATTWEAWRTEEFPASESYHGPRFYDAVPIGSEASEDAMADASDFGPSSGSQQAAPAVQGRAARRRQMAVWKKKQRRAAVVSAVALVGGGLTFALLPDGPSTDVAQAASAPEPEASATPRTDVTGSSSAETDARVSRDHGTSTKPPKTTSPPRNATGTVAAPPARRLPQNTTVTARPTATTSPQPDTTPPAAANGVSGPQTDPAVPPTTTPSSPSGDGSAGDTSTASPAPTATSPARVCLLVLCVG